MAMVSMVSNVAHCIFYNMWSDARWGHPVSNMACRRVTSAYSARVLLLYYERVC